MTKKKLKTLYCLVCSKEFIQIRSNQNTCSKECHKLRDLQLRREYRKRNPKPLFRTTCPKCGHIYKTYPKRTLHSYKGCRVCGKKFIRKHPMQVLCGDPECKKKNTRMMNTIWQRKNR